MSIIIDRAIKAIGFIGHKTVDVSGPAEWVGLPGIVLVILVTFPMYQQREN